MEQPQAKNWQTVDPTIWTYEKQGESIEGFLRDKRFDVGKNESNMYVLEKEDGSLVSIWGSAILDQKINLIKLESYIRVTFEGKKDIGKNMAVKLFKVEVAK